MIDISEEARLGLIMLSELPGIGERRATRLCALARDANLSLTEILRLPPPLLADRYHLPLRTVAYLSTSRPEFVARCRSRLALLRSHDANVVQPGDPEYPRRWVSRTRPPPIVYRYGNAAVQQQPTLALLSSRGVTQRSVTASIQVVQHAARAGLTLVGSGMKGPYRIATVAARAAGAPRIVVLDRGLLTAFGGRMDRDPFGFGPGRAPFDRARTMVLSSFRLGDHAVARNGARRDELVAALADIIVAVSVRIGGTIERVCLAALDRGQCVLSWYGDHAGLLAAGATPVDETDLGDGLTRFIGPRPRDC